MSVLLKLKPEFIIIIIIIVLINIRSIIIVEVLMNIIAIIIIIIIKCLRAQVTSRMGKQHKKLDLKT